MMLATAINQAELGRVPTWIIRKAIRALCRKRAEELDESRTESEFLRSLEGSAVAEVPALANSQHYELPAEFFRLALGKHLKYSSAIWPEGVDSLDQAEKAMLALTCERAGLSDGDSILELGCGWGSLSLFMARKYPNSRIVSISNSVSQREYIMGHGFKNLKVVTADMNTFDTTDKFSRIVSVEMFEHMRDWRVLLGRVNSWLEDDGTFFMHVFCHARTPYLFETEGPTNWMGENFFSGGMMPSFNLAPVAAEQLELETKWWLSGMHYQRTAAAWRQNLDARKENALAVLKGHYGEDAGRWYHRWRIFFLACEELFGYASGAVWGVGHYRFRKQPTNKEAGF